MEFELINFCEFNEYASKAYSLIHNEPESKNLGDITKVNEKEIADFNWMVGGSPCQDFSVAGKGKGAVWTCMNCKDDEGNDYQYNPLEVHYTKRDKCPKCNSTNIEKTRSSLVVEWLRILLEKKPNLAIYENVKNLVGKKHKYFFDLFINELHEYGYNTYWKVLNAKDYGIPQNRERVYLIIVKKELDNGKFRFPKGFDNGIRLKDVLEEEVDEKYYISQEKADKLIEQLKDKEISNTIRSGGRGSLDRHTWDIVCVEDNKIMQVGMLDIKGNEQVRRVYNPDGVSPTLNTMGGGNRQPKIIEDNGLIQVGMLDGKGFESRRRVCSSEGLSPTLHGIGSGGNTEPKILEDFYTNRDVREYEDYSPTLRADRQGLKVVQGCSTRTRNYIGQPEQLEIRNDELSNSITTVQKDSMALEVSDGFVESKYKKFIKDHGYISEMFNPYNQTEIKDFAPTQSTQCGSTTSSATVLIKDIYYRIRKLIPLECFRLMAFEDKDFYILKENKISDTQCYKMAGNSIVVDVLYYIYLELYKAMPYLFEDIKLGSFFSGIGAFEKALKKI